MAYNLANIAPGTSKVDVKIGCVVQTEVSIMTQRLLALGTLMAIATIGAHAQKTYTSASDFLADAKLSYSDDFTSVADGAFTGTYTAPGGS